MRFEREKIQHKKKVPHVLIFMGFLSLFLILSSKASTVYVSSTDFNVLILSGTTLQFQNDVDKLVTLEVTSGLLNSTTNKLYIYDGGGQFRFNALNDSTIKISYTVPNVKVNGDQDNNLRVIKSDSSITVSAGNQVSIVWDMVYAPLLPIMFIIGMFGLGSLFGGPLYAIHQIRQRKYRDALVNGIVITVLGVAFVLAWLWG